MRRDAVTARLREMSRLKARAGYVDKRPAMTSAAITARLQTLGALSDMCRRLARIGAKMRQRDGD